MPTMSFYLDEIKTSLTGYVLELELEDSTLQKIVNASMRELQRYICSTKIITIPYQKCIDMTPYKVNAVVRVYRANADGVNSGNNDYEMADPMQVGIWQITSNMGNMTNYSNYVSNFASYSTMQQISNTLSTDLIFYYEDFTKKLYINTDLSVGSNITIEFVPRFDSVDEIKSDYWIDILMRLAIAKTKIILGRVRGRYTQSNALWTQDADTILAEGKEELTELQTQLKHDTMLIYPLD